MWNWNLFRLAVIEAGIRGELTADWRAANPNIEPAHTLLERIAEEKAELIRTKQIRKETPLPPINPKEVPFDIPKSWEWTRFRDVFTTSSGGTPSRTRPEFWNGPVTWYKSGELTDSLEPLRDCSEETISELGLEKSSTKLYNEGTLLIAMYGATAGKLSILGRSAATNQAICGAVPLGDFNLKYGFRTLESFRDVILEDSWGMSQPNISQTYLQEFLVPVPPPEEQQEIVQILSALDSGESDGPLHPVVARIQKLEKEFRALAGEYESQEKWLSDLRSALLQEAISGELTADWRAANPDIEPAHALLERIAEEKAELIRTKQIPKEKPVPAVNSDEVPFGIPPSWTWCRIGDLAIDSGAGKSPNCPKRSADDNEWGVLKTTAIQSGYFIASENKVLPDHLSPQEAHKVRDSDFLITRAGPIQRVGIACLANVGAKKLVLSDKTIRIQFSNRVKKELVVFGFQSMTVRNALLDMVAGMSTTQVNISQKNHP